MSTLSKRLKQAMFEAGKVTQAELAQLSGLSQPTICRLVNGSAHGSTKLMKIANALQVNVEWLSEGRGPMHSDGIMQPIMFSHVRLVHIWDGEEQQSEHIFAPTTIVTRHCRAYKIDRNTGISDVPAGTLIVVDPDERPGDQDIVYASVNGFYSAYKYLAGGKLGYLAVDDSRIDLLPITDLVKIIGVVVFLSRELRRRS